MSLEGQRQIELLRHTLLPERTHEIEIICGRPIPYEVDWDSFAGDAEALRYVDNLSCHRLNMALRTICTDSLGRAAVRKGLRLVLLGNAANRNAMRMSFDDGVLEMRCAYRLHTDGMHRDDAIRALLMSKL